MSSSCEGLSDHAVEVLGRGQVGTERFLADNAGPASLGRLVEARVSEHEKNLIEVSRGAGEVKEAVGGSATFCVQCVETLFQLQVAIKIGKFALGGSEPSH